MDECALWGQQFLLLQGLRSPLPSRLCWVSVGAQQHLWVSPGAQIQAWGSCRSTLGLSWAQGVQCPCSFTHLQFHGSVCSAASS